MNLERVFSLFRHSLLNMEVKILDMMGFSRLTGLAPGLVIQGPTVLPKSNGPLGENSEEPNFLDSIFWMAAPKKRRTIEINRCRRRNPQKLIKVETNIELCPACGNLKQKHVLCGYCYEKVKHETAVIRRQIQALEEKPLNSPSVETVVLYEGENPEEDDKNKRIVERSRKRPNWFSRY
ncbi:39S ribosomal protein L32, mitochondrial [Erpetoichthys calabaricus]|uniref:Large ribosomal subunit protein bL32m n=1 Tax=Erpetoichthys calabaricus TaxID=27687 RepID=A0A8C4TE07_ERPCA|nr:39S ribosomal protein L32, mitochondrial [Erpetoichthys calabaricus]